VRVPTKSGHRSGWEGSVVAGVVRERSNRADNLTTYLFDNENRLKTMTSSDNTIMTSTYSGDGLRRSAQQQGQTVHTMIWDGSDYLGEVH